VSAQFANEWLQRTSVLWTVSALAATLFVATNLPWHLDDYDQAKQAFTSFEMVQEGHWFFQRTPQERVATKPPFVGWISAGIFEATRSWDLAWRLPSLLAAGVLSILLFRASKNAFGGIAGLIALGAFAFNLLSPRLAGLVRTDMPLALVVFLVGLQIWKKVREGGEWQPPDRRWLFVLLTIGVLIKGPIVYAFLLPGIAFFQWWRRRSGASSAWCGWWPWLASLSIFLIWVISGSLCVPHFYDQVVMREFIGRFGETVHRPQPFYFYWPHILHKFAPWSALLVALAMVDLRATKWKWREIKISPETLWLICWALGGLILMSFIPSKRVDRIFPVMPPLCLLLATQISGRSATILRWVAVALILSIFCAAGYSGFKVFTGYRDHRGALVEFGRAVRAEAVPRQWRYEIVESSDEGLLLYLHRLHFITQERAVAEWNSGNLDALVARVEDAPRLLGQLPQSKLSPLRSRRAQGEARDYVLITH
jgi:4-amino-4-deoxy-L-arabinose transferase-like glycosyltransferase